MPKKKEKVTPLEISNCSFVGVKFDAKAVDAIHTIAVGLIENAKGLYALATVLKASNVTIECLVKVEADK